MNNKTTIITCLSFLSLLLTTIISFHSYSMNKEASLQEQSPLQFLPTEMLLRIATFCNPAGRSRLVRTCTWFNQLLSLGNLTEWLASDTELSRGECIKIITHCAQEGCVLPHNLSSNNHYKEVLQDILYFFADYVPLCSEIKDYIELSKNQNAPMIYHYQKINIKICNAIVNAKDIIGDILVGREYKSKALLNIVLFCIVQNVNLNASDYCNNDETLLHKMCSGRYYNKIIYSEAMYISTIELLLKHRADPNIKTWNIRRTPLNYLTDWHDYGVDDNTTAIKIAKLLLTYGADPNLPVDPSALGKACRYNDMEMAELLLAHGADPDISEYFPDCYSSPLKSAHKHKNEKLIQLIAQHRRGIGSLQDLYYW